MSWPMALLMLAGLAAAQTEPAQPQAPERVPRVLSPVMRELPRGLLLRLPIIDTDPNRGITAGFMPIWALEDARREVRHIHAPSVDYNHTFGATLTYRYFFYPKPDADLNVRGSISQIVGRELFLKYQDQHLAGSPFAGWLKARFDQDGSYRFYGIGPATTRETQSNYTGSILGYRFFVGYPVLGRLYLNVGQRLESQRIVDGPIEGIGRLSQVFPSEEARHYHQDAAVRAFASYDTRDFGETPTRGAYVEAGAETAQRRLASEHTYQRYLVDARGFLLRPGAHRQVTALRVLFDQVTGPPTPFWLDPSLGGKFTLRAYGEGRFTDRGLAVVGLEHRVLVYRTRLSRVWTELELAPLLEAGTVFATPGRLQSRYVRPAYGAAARVVARPQIVGSVDVAYGQEGPATFVDIRYSF